MHKATSDYAVAIAAGIVYVLFGFYFERHDTAWILTFYLVVFTFYLLVVSRAESQQLNFWLYAALLFRLLFVFSIPRLSDDFYRFVWDGHLLAGGYHPFAETPGFYIEQQMVIPGITDELYAKLNSPDYFTVYPPIAQFIFWLAVKTFPSSIHGQVFLMKLILVACETGTIVLMRSMLRRYQLPEKRVLLYALNPLVIIELVGNIHLEAVMIFFLLLAVHSASTNRFILAGVAMAFAVCVKLLPLVFLPAMVFRLKWQTSARFLLAMTACGVLLFLPLWNQEIVLGFRDSLGYYFRKFEFNASVFYIVRAVGLWFYGYDIIQTVGWKLALIGTVIILWISAVGVAKRVTTGASRIDPAMMGRFLVILLIYFLFATTVHPWYVTSLVALTVFTPFRFPVVWSGMIFLTYLGYTEFDFQEPFGIIAVEYIAVLGYLGYELIWKRNHFSLQYS